MNDYQGFVARLTPNGTLDLTYATNGYYITSFPVMAETPRMTLQPDGKPIVAGTLESGEAIAIRLLADGSTTVRPVNTDDRPIIYPNPVVSDRLFVQARLTADRGIALYDALGRKTLVPQVTQTGPSSFVLDVSGASNGQYELVIRHQGQIIRSHVVIEH
jgi:hypothetical protein